MEKHSKLYWFWRKCRYFWKIRVPEFFRYLFYELPRNYYLVKKYPFLKPSCGWGVDMEYHHRGYRYHYEETWLDGMPRGWRRAFGIQLCKELKKAIDDNHLENYAVHQVKEKFGELCWYDEDGNKNTNNIISKYEKMSTQVCQRCGQRATYRTKGWIGYYCKECIEEFPKTRITKMNS